MAQELVPEADVAVGAGDEARDVGDGQLEPVAVVDGAHERVERRERVRRDARVRVRDGAQQRRLSRVGQAHQAHVRNRLELQLHLEALRLFARRRLARCTVRRRRKVRIPCQKRKAPITPPSRQSTPPLPPPPLDAPPRPRTEAAAPALGQDELGVGDVQVGHGLPRGGVVRVAVRSAQPLHDRSCQDTGT